jgi:hypothetical protein
MSNIAPSDRIEKAELNLKAIEDLKKFPAFRDYYLPRLKMKQAALQERVMAEKGLKPRERERLRRIWQEYQDEILPMLDVEAGVEKGIIARK